MTLNHKVAVITGVSSGLGRVIARTFAAQGAAVVGAARRHDLGEDLAREIEADGGVMRFVAADVAHIDDIRRLMDTAVAEFGRIDILVNNAGTLGDPPLVDTHDLTEQYWDDVVGTNLKGALFCSRFALTPMLAQRGGVILNIGSLTALMPTARALSYTVSKSALLALTRQLALEYVGDGIRCNAVVLGHVETGMSSTLLDDMARFVRGPTFRRSNESKGMGGTALPAADVAELVALLCSDDCRLITGAAIPVDGALSTGLMASTLRYLHSAELILSPSQESA